MDKVYTGQRSRICPVMSLDRPRGDAIHQKTVVSMMQQKSCAAPETKERKTTSEILISDVGMVEVSFSISHEPIVN